MYYNNINFYRAHVPGNTVCQIRAGVLYKCTCASVTTTCLGLQQRYFFYPYYQDLRNVD